MLCFRNFPVAKEYMDERGELGRKGVPRFSVEFFFSRIAEKFRRGTFCAVCVKISGSQKIYG